MHIFNVEKIQTDMRSELKFDTICASMVTEQIQQSTYLNCEPNVAVLKSAKKNCNNISIWQSKLQKIKVYV